MIGVAAMGDILDINCWSNIPYYFFTTGRDLGVFETPFRLHLNQFSYSRKLWNVSRIVSGHYPGGYQFSKAFLQAAESQFPSDYFKKEIISLNQVFPRAQTVKKWGGKINYYIDTTLTDLFQDSFYKIHLSKEVMRRAIEIEKENYFLAARVVVMGSWVKKSLIEDYGMDEKKISIILPGANLTLPKTYHPPQFRPGAGKTRDFTLGFVGKDWERKGLPLLISIKNAIKAKGYRIKIKVMGRSPLYQDEREDIEYTGFIDKKYQMEGFIRHISECDLGCLFSKGEALGISTLEFIRAGIPVAGFFHQGLLDTLMPEISLRFDLEEELVVIVNRFLSYLENEEEQKEKFQKISQYSEKVTWGYCIENWQEILGKKE